MVSISEDWNINYLTKQIYHDQWKDEINGSSSADAEESSFICGTKASLTAADYLLLYSAKDETAYYVWYDVTGSDTDPAPTGKTGIRVDVNTDTTAIEVATRTVTAIDAANSTLDFDADNSSGASATVTIVNKNDGSTTDIADFNTGFTSFTTTTQGIGETISSTNALYSYLQDTFDELGQMDDQVPMSAQTPTEYSLINEWFIDEVSIKYLNGGAIKTIGWLRNDDVQGGTDNNGIIQVEYDSGTPVTSDIGLPVVLETDLDAGTCLFIDTTRSKVWIRPDSTAQANSFDSTSGYNIDFTGGTQNISLTTDAGISGENTWANMYSIGTIESNTAIYVIQDGAKISAWWPVDHIDILIRVREMGSTTGANSGDLGELMIGARQYGKLFDHFVSTGITGGRNPVPLATSADLNNTTGQYTIALSPANITFADGDRFQVDGSDPLKEGTVTDFTGTPATSIDYYLSGTDRTQFADTNVINKVGATGTTSTVNGAPTNSVAGYSDITLAFSDISRDLNNGNGSQPYDVEIDLTDTRTVAELYEWLKFVTMRGYTNSPAQLKTGTGSTADTNIDGEQYIRLLSSFTPVKASPFGTFAGGKFFGAQGVWLANIPAADAQNFQLIDADGDTQIPPNTVGVTVSSVVANDVVGVFPLTAASGTVEKTTYTVTTGALGGTTVLVSTAINSRVPQTGVIRIVDDDDAAQAETQYEYYSWDTSTFSLNSSTDRGLGTLTATGGSSTTILIDSAATFQTWRLRAGDIITNVTDTATATVVTVDSQTQLTTTVLSSGSYDSTDEYTFETQLTTAAETGVDTLYVPIINEVALSTSVSNTLIYVAPVIPVLVRVRQGKVILPFEIETEVNNSGMSQAAIRTADTIAT